MSAHRFISLLALTVLWAAAPLRGQTLQRPDSLAPVTQAPGTQAQEPATICGQQIPPPAQLPPANSGPVVWLIAPCFEAQGGTSLIDVQTYLYYIQLKPSAPSQGVWVPYDETTDKTMIEDFHRLWSTNFLDNLWVDVRDYTFSNGVVGKLVTYNMEERQRVKIVDYVGSKKIETSKIDDKLKEASAVIRLDTFIDPGLVRKVEGIVRDMLKEKGFQYASVTHEIQAMPGGPKLVHLTFHMDEGPKVRIRKVEFIGNQAIGSGALKRQMKENKEQWWLSFISGRGTYQENKYEEDADNVTQYYLDHGYINARVGEPDLKFVEDSKDKKTRWVELRIPITEGRRYKVGDVTFDGNTVVKSEFLRPLFKLNTGDYYSNKLVRKGYEKAKEVYGTGGYFEFTGYPDLKPRDRPNSGEGDKPDGSKSAEAPKADGAKADGPKTDGSKTDGSSDEGGPPAARAPAGGGSKPPETAGHAAPIVDVTLKIVEGKQYFVNRITFTGNTTTRDSVIRREVRLLEGGVFNTEALKFSIKRLNQLGYFKPLEGGKDVTVDKTPGVDNRVDVKLKLEEQNRNQLTFGAGFSQFEGTFGQLSFQTANFLGRGESLTVSLQAGSRAQNYTLGITEPFLFDRNITGGFNLFRSDIRYIGQFTQKTAGGALTSGFRIKDFTQMFFNYQYERVRVTEINHVYQDPIVLARNPFLRDSLLIGQSGERIISKVVPTLVHNTVDNPIFPTSGRRYTLAIDLAGLGGNTNFYKPLVEGVWYWRQNGRLTLGTRAQYEYIHTFSGSKELPFFERLFLGGEYSIRGFDIRTIGPADPVSGLVLGGNKSLLFNIEEMISIAGPVRLILFYDAGQVEPGPELVGPAAFVPTGGSLATTVKPGVNFRWEDFKTSTGAEVRFFMPVLNVPFRLIFAYNPQRAGVLDNNLQPQTAFQFRFAVGSTF
jgi:outer membrane protein insertion porin family